MSPVHGHQHARGREDVEALRASQLGQDGREPRGLRHFQDLQSLQPGGQERQGQMVRASSHHLSATWRCITPLYHIIYMLYDILYMS